jgi:capsular polysaccharide biosynthesis protein
LRSAVSTDSDNSRDRRIYITRQQATRGRRVINYDEVVAELHRREFEVHALETYSLTEQLKLFVEADIIMGPHGAGLLNMLFADTPHVVELFPKTVIKPHFYFLSQILSAEYDAIVTEAQENNLLVEMDHFRERLDEFGITAR